MCDGANGWFPAKLGLLNDGEWAPGYGPRREEARAWSVRDSKSENTTIKVAGGCLIAIVWLPTLPYLLILIFAECGHLDDCGWRPWPLILLIYAIAAGASAIVWRVAKHLARKSDGE
jgi:hypothetical protein